MAIFACLFFSIPAFSFNSRFSIITWILSILLFGLIFVQIIIFYKVKIDLINISLGLFCVSLIISSGLNGFRNFSFTYIFLTLFSVIIYTYCNSNKSIRFGLLFAAYLGTILFLCYFCVAYWKELISLNFNRLGAKFGDENDIAIFNCLGACFSLYYLFFNKNIFIKVSSLFLTIVFTICAVSSGSKIVILLIFGVLLFFIIYLNGMRRWWVSVLEISILLVLGIIFLNLPFASEIKRRFLSMINIFTSNQIEGANQNDLSTIDRLTMFLDGTEMFLRKPLFGYGTNGFATYGGINNGWSHNHISEILCNTGIVGSILYHFPIIISIYSFFKQKQSENVKFFFIIVFYCIAMISIALPNEKMFAFIIGIIYSKNNDLRKIIEIDIKRFFKSKKKVLVSN